VADTFPEVSPFIRRNLMGKENNVLNSYLSEPSRFADLFNCVCFKGAEVINEKDLSDASEKYSVHLVEKSSDGERTEKKECIRDIKKKYDNGIILRILAVENQNYIDYTAGVRNMQYDTMEYTEQVRRLRAEHRSKGSYGTHDERLSGILRTDRLHPAYTIWIYHGEERWDGPRTLRDMMDFGRKPDEMGVLFNDYGINLVCLNEMEDYSLFRTEIGQLFEMMKYRRDKKGLENLLRDNEKYKHLDADTVEVRSVMLHRPGIWKNRDRYMKKNENEQEEYNMCQALQEICDESESVGFNNGIEKATINSIKAIMETMNLTMDKAMDALRIPEGRREYYRKTI